MVIVLRPIAVVLGGYFIGRPFRRFCHRVIPDGAVKRLLLREVGTHKAAEAWRHGL
jgi:hypothetical protein